MSLAIKNSMLDGVSINYLNKFNLFLHKTYTNDYSMNIYDVINECAREKCSPMSAVHLYEKEKKSLIFMKIPWPLAAIIIIHRAAFLCASQPIQRYRFE